MREVREAREAREERVVTGEEGEVGVTVRCLADTEVLRAVVVVVMEVVGAACGTGHDPGLHLVLHPMHPIL